MASLLAVAFALPGTQTGRSAVLTRRGAVGAFVAAAAPVAVSADGANSKATVDKARAIYGSRVVRLASASPEAIIEDQNAITLFISGAYRAGSVTRWCTKPVACLWASYTCTGDAAAFFFFSGSSSLHRRQILLGQDGQEDHWSREEEAESVEGSAPLPATAWPPRADTGRPT